jgi:L-ascorbate metabolism protein UlaG (beta-lactamase superfamily)
MRIRWYGHACFLVEDDQLRVLVDPFPATPPDLPGLAFRYAPVRCAAPHVVLVTHEHWDHNASGPFEARATVVRDPGRHKLGSIEVEAVVADHDNQGGRLRGQVLLMCWRQGGFRLCHLGDFGQDRLTHVQRQAIAQADVLFVPVGGGPTIDGARAARLVAELAPRYVLPMHYRTPAVNFLDTVDTFLNAVRPYAATVRLSAPELQVEGRRTHPTVFVLPAPVRAGTLSRT